MQKFWIDRAGNAEGPYTIEEVGEYVRRNVVDPRTKVLIDGTVDWIAAENLPAIAALFAGTATRPATSESRDSEPKQHEPNGGSQRRPIKLVVGIVLGLGGGALVLAAATYLPSLIFPDAPIADVVLEEGLPSQVSSLRVYRLVDDDGDSASIAGFWASILSRLCGGTDIGSLLMKAEGQPPQALADSGFFEILQGEAVREGLQCGQRLSSANSGFHFLTMKFEDGDQQRSISLMELGDLDDPPFPLSHNFSGLEGRCHPKEDGSTECSHTGSALVRREGWWAFGDWQAVSAYAREWNRGDDRSETTNMEYARLLAEQLEAAPQGTAIVIRPEELPFGTFCENLPGGTAECLPDEIDDARTRIRANIRGVAVQAHVPNEVQGEAEVAWTMSFATRDEGDAEKVGRDLDELLRDWRAHLENREPAFIEQNRESDEDDVDRREVMLRVFIRAMREAEVEVDGRVARLVARGELSDGEQREIQTHFEGKRRRLEATSRIVEAVIAGNDPEHGDLTVLMGEDAASWMLQPRATEQTCERIRGHISELSDGGVATADFGKLFQVRQRYVETPCLGTVMPGTLVECLTGAADIGVMAACPQPIPPWLGQPEDAGESNSPPGATTDVGNSNFGTITLAPGFTPDPHVENGTAGAGAGSRDASTLDPSCGGTIDATPDHILVLTGPSSNLRIMANSNIDTTLVIQKPDGTYACNDDSSGLDPMVILPNARAGAYRVWLGSYDANEAGDKSYKLGISELTSVTPSHASLRL